jgi:hypothetical protein
MGLIFENIREKDHDYAINRWATAPRTISCQGRGLALTDRRHL